MGKVLSLLYIAQKWANEKIKLWNNAFDAVIRIALRNLTKDQYPNDGYDLPDVLRKEFSLGKELDPTKRTAIETFINNKESAETHSLDIRWI